MEEKPKTDTKKKDGDGGYGTRNKGYGKKEEMKLAALYRNPVYTYIYIYYIHIIEYIYILYKSQTVDSRKMCAVTWKKPSISVGFLQKKPTKSEVTELRAGVHQADGERQRWDLNSLGWKVGTRLVQVFPHSLKEKSWRIFCYKKKDVVPLKKTFVKKKLAKQRDVSFTRMSFFLRAIFHRCDCLCW